MNKKEKKRADTLWSKLVKDKAGWVCEYDGCNKTKYLNSHHIFSRSNHSTRWDLDNGICLCSGHHTLCTFSAHKAPMEFSERIIEKRGEKWLDDLRYKAKQLRDKDDEKVFKYLEEQNLLINNK